MTGYVGRC